MDIIQQFIEEYDELMKKPTMSEEDILGFLLKYELDIFESTGIEIGKQKRDMNIFQMYDTANFMASVMRHRLKLRELSPRERNLVPDREQSIAPWSPGAHK